MIKSIGFLMAAGLSIGKLLDQEAGNQELAARAGFAVQKGGLVALPTAFSAAQSHGSFQPYVPLVLECG